MVSANKTMLPSKSKRQLQIETYNGINKGLALMSDRPIKVIAVIH
jgi:hypothetical protein